MRGTNLRITAALIRSAAKRCADSAAGQAPAERGDRVLLKKTGSGCDPKLEAWEMRLCFRKSYLQKVAFCSDDVRTPEQAHGNATAMLCGVATTDCADEVAHTLGRWKGELHAVCRLCNIHSIARRIDSKPHQVSLSL